ncbi:MAG: alpha/beta hydrolase [Thermomicrobiales bacterium]
MDTDRTSPAITAAPMLAREGESVAFTRRLAIGLGVFASLPVIGVDGVGRATASVAAFEGRVDVGGRALYVEARGEGGPTVVFQAGALGRSDIWSRDLREPVGARTMVLPGVATFAHVFTYDRPGTIGEVNPALDPTSVPFYPSRSDPVPQPRTTGAWARELRAALDACDVPGPYVLVGHSLGGLSMRYFASTYPDDVVGMVLVDATHEDVYTEFRKVMTPEQWQTFDAISTDRAELLAAYPEAEIFLTSPIDEDPSWSEMREAEAVSPLRPMPLVVLSHGIPFAPPFPGWPTETMEGVMMELQDRLAALVPDARHIIAERSGHDIHQDQPDLVIAAIRQVVEAVRDPSGWTSPATPDATPS